MHMIPTPQWQRETDEWISRSNTIAAFALRTQLFGRDAVEKRQNAFGEFGRPLQHIINAYAYGDVWNRGALPLATKSLAMVAMMAAGGGHGNELRVHLKGALEERLQGQRRSRKSCCCWRLCLRDSRRRTRRIGIASDVLREEKLI